MKNDKIYDELSLENLDFGSHKMTPKEAMRLARKEVNQKQVEDPDYLFKFDKLCVNGMCFDNQEEFVDYLIDHGYSISSSDCKLNQLYWDRRKMKMGISSVR